MPSTHLTPISQDTLQRIRRHYQEISSLPAWSLEALFNSNAMNLGTYCRNFQPHDEKIPILAEANSFCRQYQLLLPSTDHYLTCALFVFPDGPASRTLPIVKNLAIDFFLNDTTGRELIRYQGDAEIKYFSDIRDAMANRSLSLPLRQGATLVEIANREVLLEIGTTSDASWFEQFIDLYCRHIQMAHQNNHFHHTGPPLSVQDYITVRCHISGMLHTISFIEYSTGYFLDWQRLSDLGIGGDLEEISWAAAKVGCLMNDFFSFEKEAIDHECDSNLLVNFATHHPDLPLSQVILQSSAIVRDLLSDFIFLLNLIRDKLKGATIRNSPAAVHVEFYLAGLERCIMASWVWQVHTDRYKRTHSIWKETSIG